MISLLKYYDNQNLLHSDTICIDDTYVLSFVMMMMMMMMMMMIVKEMLCVCLIGDSLVDTMFLEEPMLGAPSASQ